MISSRDLGNVTETIMGQAPPGSECNKDGIGTPFVKAGEFGVLRPEIREWTTKPLRMAKKDDVLVCVVGATSGKVNRGEDCAIGRSVAAIRTENSLLDHDYLYYFMLSWSSRLLKMSQGAAQTVITKDMIHNLQIPLPPLSEQKRIAAILDQADQLRKLDQQLLDKYDELAQSVFLDMFGDPVTNPKGWEKVKLEEISKLTTKGESPKWQGYDYQETGILFITSENVRLGFLDCSKGKYIPVAFHEKLKRSQLKEGDLLFNLVGASIGRGALVSKDVLPANINQAVAKTELDSDKINPLFLLSLVITPQIQDRLIGNKVEGARANISLKNVRELELYLPPLDLQEEFAQVNRRIELQKTNVQQNIAKSEELFQSLLQRAFKGQL